MALPILRVKVKQCRSRAYLARPSLSSLLQPCLRRHWKTCSAKWSPLVGIGVSRQSGVADAGRVCALLSSRSTATLCMLLNLLGCQDMSVQGLGPPALHLPGLRSDTRLTANGAWTPTLSPKPLRARNPCVSACCTLAERPSAHAEYPDSSDSCHIPGCALETGHGTNLATRCEGQLYPRWVHRNPTAGCAPWLAGLWAPAKKIISWLWKHCDFCALVKLTHSLPAPFRYRENTLKSCKKAVEAGASFVEFDLQVITAVLAGRNFLLRPQ